MDLESEHMELRAERTREANESRRLRDVNAALTVLLLGENAPPSLPGEGDAAGVAQSLQRVLELHKRLTERSEAQADEKQKLVDRIRELEKQALQPEEPMPAKAKFAPTVTSDGQKAGTTK